MPAAQESVVGTIVARHGEGYRVDIGGAHMASLDALAFENATKRNRPNLKVGPSVAISSCASPESPPSSRSNTWVTGAGTRLSSLSHLTCLAPLPVQVGTVVYARVSLANRDMEPELECFAAESHKAEGFGELKDGGMLVSCSLQMARSYVPHFLPNSAAVRTLIR